MSSNKAIAVMGMIRQITHIDVCRLPQKILCELKYITGCLEQICDHEIKRRALEHVDRLNIEQQQLLEDQAKA